MKKSSVAELSGGFALLTPNVVFYAFNARLFGAVGAAEKSFFGFDAVSDYFAAAMSANGREPVNRALKTIENVPVARRYNFKRQIIIVTANFALCHNFLEFQVSSRDIKT